MKDKKKTDLDRDPAGKFKRKEPEPEKVETEEKPRTLLPIRVTGAGTKSAKIQTHNLKMNEIGEALPEFVEGVEEDE